VNDEQVERILTELTKTRESFEAAINQIRWNRINTAIQYVLLAVVVVMLGVGVKYYLDEKQLSCERGNDLRQDIQSSLDSNAASIGATLVIVTDAPEGIFQEYLDIYNQQNEPEVLRLRSC